MSNRMILIGIKSLMRHRKAVATLFVYSFMCSILILDFPVKFVDNSSADSPMIIDISSTSNLAYNGFPAYICINSSDPEDSEDVLTPHVQMRYNDSNNPPEVWYDTYLYPELYYGTPDTGWLRVRFEPHRDAMKGKYDLRAWVNDTDGNKSGYIYLLGKIEVYPPPPIELKTTLGATEVFRGDTLYIFLNITDIIYHEWELTPEIQYLPQNGSWTDIPPTNISYDFNERNWVIPFTPNYNMPEGIYQFSVRVQNADHDFSNGGAWTLVSGSVEVRNNHPIASNLRVEGNNTVKRGGIISIYADVTDQETNNEYLTPYFEYKGESEDWEDEYVINEIAITGGGNTWRINFTPPARDDFPIGPYDFRVWFEDEDGNESNIIEVEDLVEVKNVVPRVYSLNVTSRQGHRLEPLIIIANGSDLDHSKIVLTPYFQYRGPIGDWKGYEDRDCYFLDIAQNMTGYWQIIFYPPTNADLGNYSFRVQFSDGMDTSEWMIRGNIYTLMNNDPEVEIIFPEQVEQTSSTITFKALTFDMEDDILFYIWSFGDGEFSIEESPTHTYEKGYYYSVSVRVYDSDRGTAKETITIRILDTPSSSDPISNYFLIAFWIVVIIIVVIAIFIYIKIIKRIKMQGRG